MPSHTVRHDHRMRNSAHAQQHRITGTPKADRSSHQRVVKTICTISRQINYYRRTILEMCVSTGTIKICIACTTRETLKHYRITRATTTTIREIKYSGGNGGESCDLRRLTREENGERKAKDE